MNKIMNNQKGFGVVEVLIILVVVGLIGGAGWYVSSQNKVNTRDQASSKESDKNGENASEESDDGTSTWLTFTPNSKLYTIKLPDGWSFWHQDDDCDCLYSQVMGFEAGTPATIEKTQGGRDGVFGYFIAADDSDRSAERFAGLKQQGTIKAGELTGKKYYFEQTTDAEGIGLEKGGKSYSYYFIKDGKGIYISYSINPGETNNLELVEKSIKTLQ